MCTAPRHIMLLLTQNQSYLSCNLNRRYLSGKPLQKYMNCWKNTRTWEMGSWKTLEDTLNERLAVLSNLDSTGLNQVGNEEIEKEIEESSKLKAAIQKRIVNIDLTNTANSSRDEELESFAASKNSSKKIKLKWTNIRHSMQLFTKIN